MVPGLPVLTPDKICRVCGRRFAWRRKWANDWDSVTTCSRGCRRDGVRAVDKALEAAILELLDRCGPGETICPSEAARQVRPQDWHEWLERTRRAARRLAAAGQVEFRQQSRVVDPSAARGPVRLGRAPRRHRVP